MRLRYMMNRFYLRIAFRCIRATRWNSINMKKEKIDLYSRVNEMLGMARVLSRKEK